MKNVLVTGGAGFIGSNFVRYLLAHEKSIRLINLDALTYAGSLKNLDFLPDQERHVFIKGNICDAEFVYRIFREYEIDTVVHFAAETHVDRGILGPATFIQTNIVGTFTLLEAARKVWLEEKILGTQETRFHHVSTDEVYGMLEPGDPAFTELTPYQPRSPYSAAKASSDHLVRAYKHTYGLNSTLSNCSNNYGPYQYPEKLIPLVILNALSGKPIPVYGDGLQIRDWLFVEDHCSAIYKILQEGRNGETYNIGGNNQPTNLLMIETICDLLDELARGESLHHRSFISYVKDRPGHDRRYAMDISKIKSELGWQPSVDLQEGLLKTVSWYLNNQEWIKAVQQESDLTHWMQTNYEERGGNLK